jgi:hypothetical protein
MRNRVEAVVHVLAHECFHFLRHSRQIPGLNRENEAINSRWLRWTASASSLASPATK